MTDTAAGTLRGFEIETEGGNKGILAFVNGMRELISNAGAKDTDTMIAKAGGFFAVLMGMMGQASFLIMTKNDALANVLSDKTGFEELEVERVASIVEGIDTAFADDGSLATLGFIIVEGAEDAEGYALLKAAVAEEAGETVEASEPDEPAVEVKVLTDDVEEFESVDEDEDLWDDEDDSDWDDEDDDWDDDEDDYEDD